MLCLSINAKDIYISQSGDGTQDGTSAGNAKPLSFLNSIYSWGYAPAYGWSSSDASLIQPGDNVHLVGTINAPAGGFIVGLRGSGTNGGPIKVIFETNAKISVPALSDLYGGGGPFGDTPNNLIYGSQCSYMTIDGGSNGILEATDNGTTNTYHNYFRGIYLQNVNQFTIQNLMISNLYQRIPNVDTNLGGGPQLLYNSCVGGNAIYVSGAKGLTISNTVSWNVQDGISVTFSTADTNLTVISNYIGNINHALNVAGGGAGSSLTNIIIRGNRLDGFEAWEGTNSVPTPNPPYTYVVGGAFHRDGIFFFDLQNCFLTNVDVSFNKIGPGINTPRSNVAGTGGIWLESFHAESLVHVRVYNNVMPLKYPLNWAPYWLFVGQCTDALVANNTIIALPDSSGNTTGGSFSGGGTNVMFFNNLVMGGSAITLSGYPYGADTNTLRAYNLGWIAHIQSDYNVLTDFNYGSLSGHSGVLIRHNDDQLTGAYGSTNGWTWSQNEMINTLTDWQTTFTGDVDVKLDLNSNTNYPKLNSVYAPFIYDTVAIRKGTNLTSMSSGTLLNYDYLGNLRPASGPWTIGAFEGQIPASSFRFKN